MLGLQTFGSLIESALDRASDKKPVNLSKMHIRKKFTNAQRVNSKLACPFAIDLVSPLTVFVPPPPSVRRKPIAFGSESYRLEPEDDRLLPIGPNDYTLTKP